MALLGSLTLYIKGVFNALPLHKNELGASVKMVLQHFALTLRPVRKAVTSLNFYLVQLRLI